MGSRELANKPLVEAILEVRWKLQHRPPDLYLDPHYRLLLARLFDRLTPDYPEPEELPTASFPDEMTGSVVKHRFRHAANDWPLVQVGPGIMTVNDTCKYTWADFRSRSVTAVQKLFEAHPKPDQFEVHSLALRYIDAVELDFTKEDVFAFLRDKLKVAIELPSSLFENTGVDSTPSRFAWETTFRTEDPEGAMNVRFVTGENQGKPALIWETIVHSDKGLPALPDGFATWIESAHTVAHDWFFKLIEGDLERRFDGE